MRDKQYNTGVKTCFVSTEPPSPRIQHTLDAVRPQLLDACEGLVVELAAALHRPRVHLDTEVQSRFRRK